MVQITIIGVWQFQGAEADVVESFIVDAEGLVGAFDKLVDRECGVVRLDYSVRYLKQQEMIRIASVKNIEYLQSNFLIRKYFSIYGIEG